jgi:hypothetical protein
MQNAMFVSGLGDPIRELYRYIYWILDKDLLGSHSDEIYDYRVDISECKHCFLEYGVLG